MNILITGATGFIGRYLAEALFTKYPVRCLVRKTSDITELKKLNVEIVYGDLLDKASLVPALEGIDLVYHLAGEAYSRKKKDYDKGNILATQNLLEVSKERMVKKIIFLSSVGVYKPTATKTLLTEESECKPITYYGKTKLEAEELLKKSNIPWVIIRSPVIYGPNQPDVIGKLFTDGILGKKIYFIGDGYNFRSLCFIQNLIEGLVILLEKPDIKHTTYIFSDDSPYTFNEIIETTSSIIEQNIERIYLPNILGTVSWKIYKTMLFFNLYFVELYGIKTMQINLGCDISKARKEIGYNPKVSLLEGIRNTADWIKNRAFLNSFIGK